MTDREHVIKVLAETNQRYQVVVHDGGVTIAAMGSRKRAHPAKPTEFLFDAAGHFLGCGTRGWLAPFEYPKVVLALLGVGR